MPQFNYTVPGTVAAVDQGDADLCWLAATTVLFQWKDAQSMTMQSVAQRLGRPYVIKYNAKDGLNYDELAGWRRAAGFGMQHQQCIAAEGWNALLRAEGPLITLIDGDGSNQLNHAVVVYGISGDGRANTTHLKVANGQGGALQIYSLHNFVSLFEIGPGDDALFSVLHL